MNYFQADTPQVENNNNNGDKQFKAQDTPITGKSQDLHYIHIYIGTHGRARVVTHTYTRARAHTHTHTRTYARTHARTHTHTHTHTCSSTTSDDNM